MDEPGRAIGQFTFLAGAVSQSARYQGSMCGRMLSFALPGDGEIVLTLEGSRLLGQFHGPASILPAREGTIELVRE